MNDSTVISSSQSCRQRETVPGEKPGAGAANVVSKHKFNEGSLSTTERVNLVLVRGERGDRIAVEAQQCVEACLRPLCSSS